jgi:small-conductance mechanosensitive channel
LAGFRYLIRAAACASLCTAVHAYAGEAAPTQGVLPGAAQETRPAQAAVSDSAARTGQVTSQPAPPPALPAPPLNPAQVIGYIRQTLDWYRGARDIESLPDLEQDVVVRDRLQQSALAAVRRAFVFGHAAATLLGSGQQAVVQSSHAQPETALDQEVARIRARITALQSQVTRIDARLARAPARERASLVAQRADVNAALQLEREVEGTVEGLQSFQTSTLTFQTEGARDLLGQVEDLERSVPEAQQAAAPSGGSASAAGSASRVAAAATASAAGFRPESPGIITLIGEWLSLESDRRQLSGAVRATDALTKRLDALRAPLLDQARSLVRTDVAGLDSSNLAELAAARRTLEGAADRFKQLATVLLPIGEQRIVLNDARRALNDWQDSLHARLASITGYLLTRAILLIASIGLVLVLSEVARRAVFRYLHDARRRSQFQTLRRVAVGIALALVLIFGLASRIGSLATYAGFLTAGLAVALQNVILAIVAYFFLIGRYGVRIGDRITLAGVTGTVADIGLVRIYLMELAGADLHPTGRIVVLSNAVLFQPQALFKQIPGADYLWHSISLTLAPTVDVQAAQHRLKTAANAVYEQYRPSIEQQHAAVQRLVDFETSMPWPEVRVRFAESGLRFEVRYPVEAEHGVAIDQKMLKTLRDVLGEEPALPVAASGEPALDHSQP